MPFVFAGIIMEGCRQSFALRAIALLIMVTATAVMAKNATDSTSVTRSLPTSSLSGVTNSSLVTNHQTPLTNRDSSTSNRNSFPSGNTGSELSSSQSPQSSTDSPPSLFKTSNTPNPPNAPVTSTTVQTLDGTRHSSHSDPSNHGISGTSTPSSVTEPFPTKPLESKQDSKLKPESGSSEAPTKPTESKRDSVSAVTVLSSSDGVSHSTLPVVSVSRPVLSKSPSTTLSSTSSTTTISTAGTTAENLTKVSASSIQDSPKFVNEPDSHSRFTSPKPSISNNTATTISTETSNSITTKTTTKSTTQSSSAVSLQNIIQNTSTSSSTTTEKPTPTKTDINSDITVDNSKTTSSSKGTTATKEIPTSSNELTVSNIDISGIGSATATSTLSSTNYPATHTTEKNVVNNITVKPGSGGTFTSEGTSQNPNVLYQPRTTPPISVSSTPTEASTVSRIQDTLNLKPEKPANHTETAGKDETVPPLTKPPVANEVNGVALTSKSSLPVIMTQPTIPSTTSADRRVIRPDRPVVIVRVTRFVSANGGESDGEESEKLTTMSTIETSTLNFQENIPESVLRSGTGNSGNTPNGVPSTNLSSITTSAKPLIDSFSRGNVTNERTPVSEVTTIQSPIGSTNTVSTVKLGDIKGSTTDNGWTKPPSSNSASTTSSSTMKSTMEGVKRTAQPENITVPVMNGQPNRPSQSVTTQSLDNIPSSHNVKTDVNPLNTASSQMTSPSTLGSSKSPRKVNLTTEALPMGSSSVGNGSTLAPPVTSKAPQNEAISPRASSASTPTSSKVTIPVQSAAPRITPSYSSSYTAPSSSREVTYQTTEQPSTTSPTTVAMKDNIPLSSVATPALVFTVAPEQDVTSENLPQPVTAESESDKTDDKMTSSSSVVVAHITSSFSVFSKTSVVPSSSSQYVPLQTQTVSLVPSSVMSQSTVQIVPSPTAEIMPTATSDIPVEVTTSTTSRVVPDTTVETTTEQATIVTSESPKDIQTTEKSTITTSIATTKSPTTSSESTTAKRTELTTRAVTLPEVTTEAQQTETPTEETTTAESSSTTISTTVTTQSTSKAPTTVPLTYEPPLNTSSAYDEFWIITVLKIPQDVATTERDFVNGMEMKLALLFYEGLVGRVKRAATYKNATTVQMIMVNRSESVPEHTSLTYYVRHRGVLVPAEEAISIINKISSQRLAIILGYEVISMGEVYKKGPDRKLWIIGAVVGALVVFVSLIWCVLFIYFKCTRPADKRSPRAARTNRAIDPESSFRAKKDFRVSQRDLRGFDIVRTEVGLESEIQREKGRSSDSYRRMAGSSELEGMYSPGDTPPPDAPLVQPSHDAMVSSRPNSKVHSLSRPLPSLPGSLGRKGKGKKMREESSEGETTGSEKPLTPANKNQGRKKGRGWSKGHSEDSDEDTDDEDGGPTRTTHHGIRLPPLPNPPYPSESYRDSLRQQQELEDSMKNKAESERQRNKQRQRDKKKDKKSKKDLKKEAEAKKAYKMVQKEMGHMLEEHSTHQPNVFVDEQKSKSKRKRQQQMQQSNLRDSFELSELAAVHQQVEQDLRGLSSLRGDSDEESRQKAFEEARQRMHALLDDAFALIAPNPSDEELDPELDSQKPKEDSNKDKKHTPMLINSSAKQNGDKVAWSPYSAADILAKIPSEELPDNYQQKYEEEPEIHQSTDKAKGKRKNHHGYKEEINPAYEDSLKVNKEKLQKDYDDDSGYRTPGGRKRSSRVEDYSSAILDSKLFIPTGKIRSHSPPERDSSDLISTSQVIPAGKFRQQTDLPNHPNEVVSNNQSNKTQKSSLKASHKDPAQTVSPPSMDIYTLQKDMDPVDAAADKKNRLKPSLNHDEDEMDIVQKTVRHGVIEQPIVNSIRDELKRLAHRGSQDHEVI